MIPEMEFNNDGLSVCPKHNQQFPCWDSCPKCEKEWLDGHDSMRTLQYVAKIAVVVACVIGLMAFPVMAILAQK